MRTIKWVDENGYNHISLVRDDDPDDMAPRGIPLEPPDLSRLDWEELRRELHNLLVDRGLFTLDDVAKNRNGVSSSILSVFKRPIVALYKLEDG